MYNTRMTGSPAQALYDKLGLKPEMTVDILNTPEELKKQFDLITTTNRPVDFLLFFTASQEHLWSNFALLTPQITKNGMLWISWPKQSSGMKSDLNENIVREIGLKNGLVDVKVCAIDETWSGLKFVYRLKDR